jgi:hypothetical protein
MLSMVGVAVEQHGVRPSPKHKDHPRVVAKCGRSRKSGLRCERHHDRLAGLLVYHANHMEPGTGPAKQLHRAKHLRHRRRQGVAEHQSELGVLPLANAEPAPVLGLKLHRPHSR